MAVAANVCEPPSSLHLHGNLSVSSSAVHNIGSEVFFHQLKQEFVSHLFETQPPKCYLSPISDA